MADVQPFAGVFDGKTHVYPIRVYFEDTDAMGVVYHSTYLNFAERARTEMSRMMGWGHSEGFNKSGEVFAAHKISTHFVQSACLDDALLVYSSIQTCSAARLVFKQEIWRGDQVLTKLNVELACLGASGKPTRIPATLKETLESYIND